MLERIINIFFLNGQRPLLLFKVTIFLTTIVNRLVHRYVQAFIHKYIYLCTLSYIFIYKYLPNIHTFIFSSFFCCLSYCSFHRLLLSTPLVSFKFFCISFIFIFYFCVFFWCAQKAGKLHFIYALFWRFKLSERRSLCDFLFYFFLSWRFHFQFRCCACAVEWGKSCINLFLYSTNIGWYISGRRCSIFRCYC